MQNNVVNLVFPWSLFLLQENSNEGANTELKLEAVNGTTETPTA